MNSREHAERMALFMHAEVGRAVRDGAWADAQMKARILGAYLDEVIAFGCAEDAAAHVTAIRLAGGA